MKITEEESIDINMKTKEELLKEKEHYRMMRDQYSKGEKHYLKTHIVKDSEKNLERIEQELKRFEKPIDKQEIIEEIKSLKSSAMNIYTCNDDMRYEFHKRFEEKCGKLLDKIEGRVKEIEKEL